jgi:uncharacterized RDD family membrane protein YckC
VARQSAGFGRRVGAIAVDWIPCALVAWLATENPGWSALALFVVLTVLSVTFFGRTPGHAAAGIRVVTLDGARPSFPAVMARTLLICLVLPPLMTNDEGRGLHDRLAGTIVLPTR